MHYLLLKLKSISLAGAFHENHDMPRSLNRLVKNPADRNGKAAKLLGSLLMFLKSTRISMIVKKSFVSII